MTECSRCAYFDEIEDEYRAQISELENALRLIAAPIRPDGIWNRSREACQALAALALERAGLPS